MLVLLERLSSSERAVFVLREALCFEYTDIAELVGRTETNCRKLISRARNKLGLGPDELVFAETAGQEWISRFLLGLIRKAAQAGEKIQVELMALNGQTAVVIIWESILTL
jgi:predicted transcriptional regulator